MSAEVTFIAIRKVDNVPFYEAYLGGNELRAAIGYEDGEQVIEVDDGYILPLDNFKKATDFLAQYQEKFYLGNYALDCHLFAMKNSDNFSYFISW